MNHDFLLFFPPSDSLCLLFFFFKLPNCWFRVQPRFPSYPTLRSLCTMTFKLFPNLPPRAGIFSSFSTCRIYKASLLSVFLLSSTYLSSAVLTISQSLLPSPVMSTLTYGSPTSPPARLLREPWCITGTAERGTAVAEPGRAGMGTGPVLPAAGLAVHPLASELL